ncbi:MAG TPA: chemotaxis response regulator protein-glutamate methylesterase [Bryobacteraceae bacterium]|nr:chemotaxis response regulator protein-glutamate methylesterase [Bryobacteraceae bacterium]
MSLRVLVVDDTVVFRRIVSDALTGLPGVEVAGTAANGKLALARMSALQPDLVTLDIEMPEMNGIEVLEAMGPAGMKAGVIVLSSVTRRGGEMTVRALELGAFDFLTKPDGGTAAENLVGLRDALQPMIRAFERRRDIRAMLGRESSTVRRAEPARPVPAPPGPSPARRTAAGSPLVLIGVSTGGPSALATVLPALPADLNAPVLIVQHMPAMFTKPLADSLARKCALRVIEARDGDTALANCAYLAPGGSQMKVLGGPRGELILRVTDDAPENGCKPAVDYLFRSVAEQFPGRAVATILTGMGNDGTAGLRLLKRGGCRAIAQDESTCVVFGMPKEAIAAGLIDTVAPLDRIAAAIVRSVREGCA